MSDQTTEGLIVPSDPASAFAQMLDFLAPEEKQITAAPGGAPDAGAAAGAGQQPAPAEGTAAAGAAGGAPAGGDGGQPGVPNAGAAAAAAGGGAAGAGSVPAAAAGSAAPAVGDGAGAAGNAAAAGAGDGDAAQGVDVTTVLPTFETMATAFEERQTKAFEAEAFAEVKAEYAKHFDAITKPARLLVGQEVPSLTGPGMERLRDSADAKDWQDAVKQLLIDEVASRVEKRKDDARDVFTTVHASIELFRNNTDLIPGTKTFDKELANTLAVALKDYELRANGKLIGYSVPVQPIVNALRSQLVAQRAAQAAAPPSAAPGAAGAAPAATAPAAQGGAASEQPRDEQGRWTGPQAGITSKAGQSSDDDDLAAGVLGAFLRQNGVTI